MAGYKNSGGAVTIQELALADVLGRTFPLMMRDTVLVPIGMTNQHLRATAAGRTSLTCGARDC